MRSIKYLCYLAGIVVGVFSFGALLYLLFDSEIESFYDHGVSFKYYAFLSTFLSIAHACFFYRWLKAPINESLEKVFAILLVVLAICSYASLIMSFTACFRNCPSIGYALIYLVWSLVFALAFIGVILLRFRGSIGRKLLSVKHNHKLQRQQKRVQHASHARRVKVKMRPVELTYAERPASINFAYTMIVACLVIDMVIAYVYLLMTNPISLGAIGVSFLDSFLMLGLFYYAWKGFPWFRFNLTIVIGLAVLFTLTMIGYTFNDNEIIGYLVITQLALLTGAVIALCTPAANRWYAKIKTLEPPLTTPAIVLMFITASLNTLICAFVIFYYISQLVLFKVRMDKTYEHEFTCVSYDTADRTIKIDYDPFVMFSSNEVPRHFTIIWDGDESNPIKGHYGSGKVNFKLKDGDQNHHVSIEESFRGGYYFRHRDSIYYQPYQCEYDPQKLDAARKVVNDPNKRSTFRKDKR